jgi:RimJ/RimL family protein N-acetyltransferase
MAAPGKRSELQSALAALPGVESVGVIAVEGPLLQSLSCEVRGLGGITVRRLDGSLAADLFEFYTEGLTEKARRMFAPYPLFHTPPAHAAELAGRIADWVKETDWTALCLIKEGRIIGFGLLKRFWTEQVTSAIVVGDAFLKKGLGVLLQTILVEQAKRLGIPRFHVKVVSDNLASVRLHEKCGFRQTKIFSQPLYEEILQYLNDLDRQAGAEPVARRIIEMVVDLNGGHQSSQ